LDETERRMVAIFDELQLTAWVTSIHGISAVGVSLASQNYDPQGIGSFGMLGLGFPTRGMTCRHSAS
jgi:hypothetical protein